MGSSGTGSMPGAARYSVAHRMSYYRNPRVQAVHSAAAENPGLRSGLLLLSPCDLTKLQEPTCQHRAGAGVTH